MKEGAKRIILIALVIVGFVSFDLVMDFIARNFYPRLFQFVLYPVDIAGVIEYTVASIILVSSLKRGIFWLSAGTVVSLLYSFVLIATKFIF